MVREKNAKIATLALSAVVFIIYLLDVDASNVGLYAGAPWHHRLLYHFAHASFLHALMNIWCLLCVVFKFDVSLWTLLTAFAVATLFPIDTLHSIFPNNCFSIPTIGLSGVCYALMGYIAFMVQRKVYYHSWLAFYIAIGFIIPNVNGWIHLYCYIVGLAVGYLNKPIKC